MRYRRAMPRTYGRPGPRSIVIRIDLTDDPCVFGGPDDDSLTNLAPVARLREEAPHAVHGGLLVVALVAPVAPLGAALPGLDPPGPGVLEKVDVAAGQPPPRAVPPVLSLLHDH